MDFETIMVLALLACGAVWVVDARWWAPRRQAAVAAAGEAARGGLDEDTRARLSKEPTLVEYAKSFFPVILAVLLLRSFLVEPFRIPSGSMIPTLWVGDFILVNKFSYGLRLPIVDTKFVSIGEPQRGDVIVFRYPSDPSVDYIKRVIGLPGDHIAYRDKTVYVNGKPLPQEYLGPYTDVSTGIPWPAKLKKEVIDGREHKLVVHPGYRGPLDFGEWDVPEGQYFAMGDNRDNSNDSRAWGFVPEENLVGKAFFIWMNWNSDTGGITWNRLGDSIQ
ncbi:MAG TPA: signal peptidase I [Gammaproteobacteria bacterium]|nr:signal peptidase I [Gammaproteobacteria bacterium]